MSRFSQWSGVFSCGTTVSGGTEFIGRVDASVLDRGDRRTVEPRLDECIPLRERRG
jgi:hypothetical protein